MYNLLFSQYTHESVKIIPSLKDDQKKFVSEIMKCGYVIYDVSQLNEESQIVEANFVVDGTLMMAYKKKGPLSSCLVKSLFTISSRLRNHRYPRALAKVKATSFRVLTGHAPLCIDIESDDVGSHQINVHQRFGLPEAQIASGLSRFVAL